MHDDIKDLICWVFWLISVGFEDMVCFIVWFFWRKIANNKKQISQNLSDKNEKKKLPKFSTILNSLKIKKNIGVRAFWDLFKKFMSEIS